MGGEFDAEKWTGLREGEVLAGKYRIERVLGSGGMGMVVAAHHVGLDTKVAIKLLLPEMLGNAEAVGRFAIEARAAARITNEHVARVFDVGALDDGAPYMVMEFLDGSDLSERLRVEGRLPVTQAVDFVLQACEASGRGPRASASCIATSSRRTCSAFGGPMARSASRSSTSESPSFP